MKKLFSKKRIVTNAIFVFTLLAPLGISITASAQQNGLGGITRKEKIEIREEFNNTSYLSTDMKKPFLDAVTLFKAKDYAAAESIFRTVLKVKPRHAQSNYYLAEILSARGAHKSAIFHYQKSLKYYNDNPAILAKMGVSYIKIDKPKKAKSVLASLNKQSQRCKDKCANAKIIGDSVHVLSEALYNL